MKRLFTRGFDISGSTMYRVIKIGLLNKFIPLGNLKQGPGLRPAFTLLVLHMFGKPLFWCTTRFRRYTHYLRLKILRK